MNKLLKCKISQRKVDGLQVYEGTVELPGARATKLAKSSSNETTYSSRSLLEKAARQFATRLGFNDVDFGGSATTTANKKKTLPKKRPQLQNVVNDNGENVL
jgi:hypothetical protein